MGLDPIITTFSSLFVFSILNFCMRKFKVPLLCVMATKVLFHFVGARHIFLELKRPAFKQDDIAKYVSWFMIASDSNTITRLSFVSWEDTVRTFEQGVLTSSEREATFVVNGGETITAVAASVETVDASLINSCCEVWGS